MAFEKIKSLFSSGKKSSERHLEVDPVCGVKVDPNVALSDGYGGETHYFCSSKCLSQFRANPAHYVKKEIAV